MSLTVLSIDEMDFVSNDDWIDLNNDSDVCRTLVMAVFISFEDSTNVLDTVKEPMNWVIDVEIDSKPLIREDVNDVSIVVAELIDVTDVKRVAIVDSSVLTVDNEVVTCLTGPVVKTVITFSIEFDVGSIMLLNEFVKTVMIVVSCV